MTCRFQCIGVWINRHITKKRRWIAIWLVMTIVSFLYLLHVAVQAPRHSLIFTYAAAVLSIFGIIFAILAEVLGWFPHPSSRRMYLADLAHETKFAFRPFLQDLWHSFASRPAIGVVGLITAFILTSILLISWPSESTVAEIVGISLGIAGLLFGMLAYHVALRVEKAIRESVTDFREFVSIVSEILNEEILGKRIGLNPFPTTDQSEHEHVPEIPDLILLLWFPYYGLTKDFDQVGPALARQLGEIQHRACRTYLITAKEPLTLMEYFDKQYPDGDKRYCVKTLEEVAAVLYNIDRTQWDSKLADLKKTLHMQNPKIERVFDCISTLKKFISPDAARYWTACLADNTQLMNGLVQLVWTRKRAAIVFMPPEEVAPGNTSKTSGLEAEAKTFPKFGAGNPYKCSGFVTEDPFLISMVRDLIHIRFAI